MEDITNTNCSEPTLKKRKESDEVCDAVIQNGHLEKKNDVDVSYFSSYADIEIHRTMIEDQVRTISYQQAIFQKMEEYIRDKVVVDVGCGTGILSMFCAQAGAKKVYAIEASSMAAHAQQLVDANGFQDIITVIHSRAEDAELPEMVDVVVSEWMGFMLVFETMLPSVLHVRDKWMKPGGKMFPEKAVLYMALAEAAWINKYEEGTHDFWVSLQHLYNVDMSLLADHAVARYKDIVHVHMVAQEDVVSLPTRICELDLYTVTPDDLRSLHHKFTLTSMGSRCLNSFVLWFDVWFPGGAHLTTSPDTEDTHWQNTVLPVNPVKLRQDSKVEGEIIIMQNSPNYRFLDVELKYSVESGKEVCRTFKMDDNCNDD